LAYRNSQFVLCEVGAYQISVSFILNIQTARIYTTHFVGDLFHSFSFHQ